MSARKDYKACSGAENYYRKITTSEKTPLEIAKQTQAVQRGTRISDDELEVIIEWAKGRITYKQLCAGLGKHHSTARVRITQAFKQIVQEGSIYDWLK